MRLNQRPSSPHYSIFYHLLTSYPVKQFINSRLVLRLQGDIYAAPNGSVTSFDGRASPAEPRPRLLAAPAAVAVNATPAAKKKSRTNQPGFSF
jgi:hypothetical protein